MMTRRQAIKSAAFLTIAGTAAIQAPAQHIIDGRYQPLFFLPPLPYAYDALEPYIDARTMEIHHNKHHAAYVVNLNTAIAELPDFYFRVLNKHLTDVLGDDLLKNLDSVPEKIRTAVRNNGGGHYNHSLFWQMLKKDVGKPAAALAKAIDSTFGSFSAFQEKFTKAALSQFGSGWAWLVLDGNKQLGIEATSNQDSPISQGKQPLLGVDVWEHAYYLKYQNRRPDYLAAFFNVINWEFVSHRYNKLVA